MGSFACPSQPLGDSLPPQLHSRPGPIDRPSSLSPDGLASRFVEEDGARSREFTFGNVEAPAGLVLPLVAAFARVTGLGGSFRRMSSAKYLATTLRGFAREIADAYPGLTSIEELDREVWRWWCGTVSARRRTRSSIKVIRTLLRATVGLPPATRLELNAKTSTPSTTTRSYNRTEVARILSMARRVDAATRSRLAHNHEARATFGCGGGQPAASTDVVIRGEPRSLGAILDHLSTHGCMPPYYGAVRRTESSALREALRIGNSPFITALYPTRAEIYALMIMFTYRTGFNLSTLNNLRVTDAQQVSAPGPSEADLRRQTRQAPPGARSQVFGDHTRGQGSAGSGNARSRSLSQSVTGWPNLANHLTDCSSRLRGLGMRAISGDCSSASGTRSRGTRLVLGTSPSLCATLMGDPCASTCVASARPSKS